MGREIGRSQAFRLGEEVRVQGRAGTLSEWDQSVAIPDTGPQLMTWMKFSWLRGGDVTRLLSPVLTPWLTD